MKKLMCIAAAMAAIAFGISAKAGSQQFEDSEALARAFLNHDTAYYTGWFDAIANAPQSADGSGNMRIQIRFMANRDLQITNMTINDTNVPLSAAQPLSGIPIPAYGYKWANINLSSYDSDGNLGMNGYFGTNCLMPGDLLLITMYPQLPPVFIAAPSDNPSGLRLDIDTDKGYGWYYDGNRGGFIVQLYGGVTTASYTIRTADGYGITSGTVKVYSDETKLPNASMLNIKLAGGVKEVRMGDSSYAEIGECGYDATVSRNGASFPAAVFAVKSSIRSNLYIWLYEADDAKVTAHDEHGNVVPVTINNAQKGYGVIWVTSIYVDRVTITVEPGPNSASKFRAFVTRY